MAHLFVVAELHIKKAPLREQWSLEGSFAVLLDGFVPWQDIVEVLWMLLDVGVGFRSFRGVAEQPVLAADGEVADGTDHNIFSLVEKDFSSI